MTAYFLGSGIRSFYNRDPVKSQYMMRARVVSQFATIVVFMGYYGVNNFDFSFIPGFQTADDTKNQEEGQAADVGSNQPANSAN